MSTHALIGYFEDDKVVSIYLHFDGYIRDGAGQKLYENYINYDVVKKLVNNGDMSSLGNCVASTDYYTNRGDEWDMVKPQTESEKTFWRHGNDHQFDYLYLFKNDQWYVNKKPLLEVYKP